MSGKRLSEQERNEIARRIAAGDTYPTIAQAVGCTLQNVKYHAAKIRPKIESVIAESREARTEQAIVSGLSEVDARVAQLEWLNEQLACDLAGGLYGTDTKISATGKTVDVPAFKAQQVAQLRGTLDDIAKERGGRKNEVRHSGSLDFPALAALAALYEPDHAERGVDDPQHGET
jgi:hypothetical protein